MQQNICRFCMEIAFRDIFGSPIFNIIISCMGQRLCPGDGLPNNICEVCEKTIIDFHKFKEKCAQVEANLRNTSSHENDITAFCDIEEVREPVEMLLNEDINIDNITQYDIPLEISESNQGNIEPKVIRKSKPVVQCEICGQTFKTGGILKQHLSSHIGEKPFTCHICEKRFSRKSHKEIHMRLHSGEKPFLCNTCGKGSRRKQDLMRHMKVHSTERNYSCGECGRRFKRSWDVQMHMRSHTGQKPYTCHSCIKSYSSYSAYCKHIKSNSHIP